LYRIHLHLAIRVLWEGQKSISQRSSKLERIPLPGCPRIFSGEVRKEAPPFGTRKRFPTTSMTASCSLVVISTTYTVPFLYSILYPIFSFLSMKELKACTDTFEASG